MQLNDQSKFQSPQELLQLARMTGALTHPDADEVFGYTFCPHNNKLIESKKSHLRLLGCVLSLEHPLVCEEKESKRKL